MTLPEISKLNDLLSILNSSERAEKTAFEYKQKNSEGKYVWKSVTGHNFVADVRKVAADLHNFGLVQSSKLIVLAKSLYETVVIDFATQLIGVIFVPVYHSSSPAQIKHVMEETGAKFLFSTDSVIPEEILAITDLKAFTMSDLGSDATQNSALNIEFPEINSNDVCSILFTAGVDGDSKSVPITHFEIVKNVKAVYNYIFSNSSVDLSRAFSFLSLAHITPRVFLYMYLWAGGTVILTPGLRDILSDLTYAKPTVSLWVPKVFDKVHTDICDKRPHGLGGLNWLKKVRRTEIGAESDATKAYIKSLISPSLSTIFTTGQTTDSKLLDFFENLGVDTYNCYGLTEQKGVVAMNIPGGKKSGSVGRALPGLSVEVTENEEILVNGENTGDMGKIDSSGYITLIGRKRDILITSTGKRVLPEPLQQSLTSDPIIEDALVIGERRPYISALITLRKDHLEHILDQSGLDDESLEAKIYIDKLVKKAVHTANKLVSREEQIKSYVILEDGFQIDDEFIAGSLKLHRDKICKYYKNLINEELYGQH